MFYSFRKLWLATVCRRVGARAARAASKFLSALRAAKNDAALQHCFACFPERDSVTRFLTSGFFSSNYPIWAPDSRIKAFSNMASNSQIYSIKSVPEGCKWHRSGRLRGLNYTAQAAWAVSITLLRSPERCQWHCSSHLSGVNDTAKPLERCHWHCSDRSSAVNDTAQATSADSAMQTWFKIMWPERCQWHSSSRLSDVIDTTEAAWAMSLTPLRPPERYQWHRSSCQWHCSGCMTPQRLGT
jgi:hypothetical protein